jgi:Asp-tRNA(Asn)/Glu-tRNA(Gln) amidotransferase A subunit family amidase
VALDGLLEQLRGQGVKLWDRRTSRRVERLEAAIEDASRRSLAINDYEKRWPLGEIADRIGPMLSPGLREGVARGRRMSAQRYVALLQGRDAARDALAALAGDVDACLTLSATGPAPRGLGSTGDSGFNVPASYLRCPALSLPLLQADGLPLGLQILGQPGQERALSSVARWLVGKGAGGR